MPALKDNRAAVDKRRGRPTFLLLSANEKVNVHPLILVILDQHAVFAGSRSPILTLPFEHLGAQEAIAVPKLGILCGLLERDK